MGRLNSLSFGYFHLRFGGAGETALDLSSRQNKNMLQHQPVSPQTTMTSSFLSSFSEKLSGKSLFHVIKSIKVVLENYIACHVSSQKVVLFSVIITGTIRITLDFLILISQYF